MSGPSLWGDFSKASPVRTPKSILQEQADALSATTGNRLHGKVMQVTRSSPLQGDLGFRLVIVAPALNNYQFIVLTIFHDVPLYPLKFYKLSNTVPSILCKDEAAFVRHLSEHLKSEEVMRVVLALVAQSV